MQAEDTARHPLPIAGLDVIVLAGIGVARAERLACGEVAALLRGDRYERRTFGSRRVHTKTF